MEEESSREQRKFYLHKTLLTRDIRSQTITISRATSQFIETSAYTRYKSTFALSSENTTIFRSFRALRESRGANTSYGFADICAGGKEGGGREGRKREIKITSERLRKTKESISKRRGWSPSVQRTRAEPYRFLFPSRSTLARRSSFAGIRRTAGRRNRIWILETIFHSSSFLNPPSVFILVRTAFARPNVEYSSMNLELSATRNMRELPPSSPEKKKIVLLFGGFAPRDSGGF